MGRGFGVEAAVPIDTIGQIAAAAEALGYASFWVNHPPGSDGLASLAAAAGATTQIMLGVGVIPIDRHPVAEVAARVTRHALPIDRLLLGIGPGGDANGIERLRRAVDGLRRQVGSRIVTSALGPNMMRLGGEIADGVLMNWSTPEFEREAGRTILEAASNAGRPRPLVMSYVRCGLLPGARERLEERSERYATVPQYARHFTRMGVTARETTVSSTDAATLQAAIREHEQVLDETIVRAITADDSATSILELLHACAPSRAVSA